jgi:2-iminobutanoate/2-iminopropanoate deaminase
VTHHSFDHTPIPPAYGAYSHAVVAGGLAFLAGQIAREAKTGQLIEGDVARQTERCIEIVEEILGELGLRLTDIVKATVYLSRIDDFEAMNDVYSRMFTAPYPARSTPQAQLPFGALVGIEVIACLRDRPAGEPELRNLESREIPEGAAPGKVTPDIAAHRSGNRAPAKGLKGS